MQAIPVHQLKTLKPADHCHTAIPGDHQTPAQSDEQNDSKL